MLVHFVEKYYFLTYPDSLFGKKEVIYNLKWATY